MELQLCLLTMLLSGVGIGSGVTIVFVDNVAKWCRYW